ncbi:Uncharacterized protein FWK35_00025741 [Aphis craccivora]|uniref:Uncharacterized protein n=1 Tax=Aphis craccivora TaxID=307492 RepID=A0A6G0VRC5_APHCR|nr:Uncharacterized protein FWK35_00025741 [Aphis craccivora]
MIIKNGLPTTNNAVEGWHRGFTSVIGASHLNIWKFIDGIKKVQNIEELKREQYNTGEQPQKKKYKDCNLRIHAIVTNYNTYENKNFIK